MKRLAVVLVLLASACRHGEAGSRVFPLGDIPPGGRALLNMTGDVEGVFACGLDGGSVQCDEVPPEAFRPAHGR